MNIIHIIHNIIHKISYWCCSFYLLFKFAEFGLFARRPQREWNQSWDSHQPETFCNFINQVKTQFNHKSGITDSKPKKKGFNTRIGSFLSVQLCDENICLFFSSRELWCQSSEHFFYNQLKLKWWSFLIHLFLFALCSPFSETSKCPWSILCTGDTATAQILFKHEQCSKFFLCLIFYLKLGPCKIKF